MERLYPSLDVLGQDYVLIQACEKKDQPAEFR